MMNYKESFHNPFEQINQKLDQMEKLILQLTHQKGVSAATTLKEEKQLLSVHEAAEFLHLSPSTIYSLSSRQEIPFKKKGRRNYFTKEDLLRWVEEGASSSGQQQKQHKEVQQFLKPRRKKLG